MYKRILVAVDGSENSRRAAEQAAKLAASKPGQHPLKCFMWSILIGPARTRFIIQTAMTSRATEKCVSRQSKESFEERKLDYKLVSSTVNLDQPSSVLPIAVDSTSLSLVVGD